jgi:hypothetical protein
MEAVSSNRMTQWGMYPRWKQSRDTWYAGGGEPAKINLRDIYAEKGWYHSRPSFLVTTLLALVGAEAVSVIRAFGSDVPPGWTANCTLKLIHNTVLFFLQTSI